jgi:hypothetical protein
MKSGNVTMLNTLKVLATGKVYYIESVVLRLGSGHTIRAHSVAVEGFMLHGYSAASDTDFMVSAEELAAVEVNWKAKPKEVTGILSAVNYENKRA